jgi:predicted membrane-bound spermidine synthase
MNIKTWKVALLLFGSGTCALVYQMTWLREFRLIFGASTGASAAVLAIFMGGLGLGSLLLGHRADKAARPLGFYANLELLIAASAALTPLLLWAVRQGYIATGGESVLGDWGATLVRLLLAALVLLVPTFLMGGTLPAAARSVESDSDLGRRHLAFLYGANTLGAVTGSAFATFYMMEVFGNRKSLWLACLLNAGVAMIARNLSATSSTADPVPDGAAPAPAGTPTEPGVARRSPAEPPLAAAHGAAVMPEEAGGNVPAGFVLAAAGIVGFAFLLMELVWYRMLSPILGGSTFTFGLILAVALLGIGLGGAAYAVFRGNRPATLTGFALTCALEALFVAVPYALGDQLAVLAMLLRSLSSVGFWGLVITWTIITTIAVLPAAFMSGVQFPLLIALLGRGRTAVGRHIGIAYAYNTVGAIAGSLAGGFGLLPLLGAVGAWRLVVVLLALLAFAALLLAAGGAGVLGNAAGAAGAAIGAAADRARSFVARAAAPAVCGVLALALLLADGPTHAWRHGGIGAGRSDMFQSSPNALHDYVHRQRRGIDWEDDGIESSVAISDFNGFAFYVNGKADGHIRLDAGTQVMSGLVGALVHPNPRTSMVIGLGTGSTAGWLGAIPSMERVDVVELEPAILEMARRCGPANLDVLNNPKVKIQMGDAREALLTTPSRYDLIFSEPSNPYRAGIASMYTREFYGACRQRLNPGGIFLQWCQAYEVDARTVRTVYATLASVYPHVQTWWTQSGDLLLMGSAEPLVYDVGMMRARCGEYPYREAISKVWRVTDLEGVLSHQIANADFAARVATLEAEEGVINTDDTNVVEFAFARSVGTRSPFGPSSVLATAAALGQTRPATTNGTVDWGRVQDRRVSYFAYEGRRPSLGPAAPQDRRARARMFTALLSGDPQGALQAWGQQGPNGRDAEDLTELVFLANAYNELARDESLPLIDKVRQVSPIEADALLAHLKWKQQKAPEALAAIQRAFAGYRRDPWPENDLMSRTLTLAAHMAQADMQGNFAQLLFEALDQPFALSLHDEARLRAQLDVARRVDTLVPTARLRVKVLEKFEPYVPWERPFLTVRLAAYDQANHPNADRAAKELDAFLSAEPFPFDTNLVQPRPATRPATGPTTGPTTGPATGPVIVPGKDAEPEDVLDAKDPTLTPGRPSDTGGAAGTGPGEEGGASDAPVDRGKR